ncbi:hypothetical protein J7E97_13860 [Streptomyces sp. ISL-66]|uniref:hypothetical protein n=1 Tax=Streptomyces sp. ISL-66 TaxID=2819186 RepID=UPI001BECD5FE|nr:hypothetical protein [Streptomyces sp. ISL-66]MBT2468929.1 hypothetical protein [Streptomyces sp. ISL-66]
MNEATAAADALGSWAHCRNSKPAESPAPAPMVPVSWTVDISNTTKEGGPKSQAVAKVAEALGAEMTVERVKNRTNSGILAHRVTLTGSPEVIGRVEAVVPVMLANMDKAASAAASGLRAELKAKGESGAALVRHCAHLRRL